MKEGEDHDDDDGGGDGSVVKHDVRMGVCSS